MQLKEKSNMDNHSDIGVDWRLVAGIPIESCECDDCNGDGFPCYLPGEHIAFHYFCVVHAVMYSFCWNCGRYRFLSHVGLCSNCNIKYEEIE